MKNYDDVPDRYDDEILEAEPADDEYDEVIDGEYDYDRDDSDYKFGRVLDEISEIRRNMDADDRRASGRYRAPQSEAELYDEINRLRGELADTRMAHSVQEELGRLKEDIERAADEKNARLTEEIESLKSRLAAAEGGAPAESAPAEDDAAAKELAKKTEELEEARRTIARLKAEGAHGGSVVSRTGGAADVTELMRRIIDVRLALGKMSCDEYDRDIRLLSVYNALTAAKSAVYTTASTLAEKLEAMRRLANEIELSDDCYIADVAEKYNEMAGAILGSPVHREDLAVAAGLGGTDRFRSLLTPEGRTAAVRFLALAGVAKNADDVSAAADKASELASLKNAVQCDRKKAENDALCSEILSLASELAFASDGAAAMLSARLREKMNELCSLEVSEIMTVPGMVYDKTPCTVPAHSYAREAVGAAASEGGAPADDTVAALTDAVNMLRAELGGTAAAASADEIADLKRRITDAQNADREAILAKLDELSSSVAHKEEDPSVPAPSTPDELNLFLSEIVSLRDELQAYKDEVSNMADKLSRGVASAPAERIAEDGTPAASDDMGAVMDELASIRADLGGYADDIKAAVAGGAQPVAAGTESPSSAVSDELTAIRADIAAQPTAGDIADIKAEISSLREDIAKADDVRALGSEVKAALAAGGAAAIASDSGASAPELAQLRDLLSGLAGVPAAIAEMKSDIAALREEVAELKASVPETPVRSDRTDELVERIYGDVRTMVEEPDYSVMNEILALREEYQHLKESVNKILPESADGGKLLSEIEALRDQIFTINMASVSDGETQSYESYNNIIVDSINELRDDVHTMLGKTDGEGGAFGIDKLEKELAEQKQTQEAIATLLNQTLDQLQKLEESLRSGTEKITEEIAGTAAEADRKDDRQDQLLSEIENIKYTLGVIQGNESGEDADLEGSIAKLKKELSEVAGIIKSDKE